MTSLSFGPTAQPSGSRQYETTRRSFMAALVADEVNEEGSEFGGFWKWLKGLGRDWGLLWCVSRLGKF